MLQNVDQINMRTCVAVLVLLLVVPMLVAQGTPTDDRIFDEVRQKLAVDSEVRGAGFDVSVKNGVVTMRGSVHTQKGKEKAEKIAKKVKGVTGVVDELKLVGSD
jgi:osmotically-inducible protein OsmY